MMLEGRIFGDGVKIDLKSFRKKKEITIKVDQSWR